MNQIQIKTVPNLRVISVNKLPTNKDNKYTTNNLNALSNAASNLRSLAGFKLYIYIAMNLNNYTFALSSKDFMKWANVSKSAYDTAFKELVDKGYLIRDSLNTCKYLFYDISLTKQLEKVIDTKDNTESNLKEFVF